MKSSSLSVTGSLKEVSPTETFFNKGSGGGASEAKLKFFVCLSMFGSLLLRKFRKFCQVPFEGAYNTMYDVV